MGKTHPANAEQTEALRLYRTMPPETLRQLRAAFVLDRAAARNKASREFYIDRLALIDIALEVHD